LRRPTGVLLVVVSSASFGAMAIFARLAYASGADPITVLFLRFTIATAVMLGLLRLRRQPLPRGRLLLGLIGMGALGYVGQSICYFTALTVASAGLVALLLYLYPILVVILAAAVFRERITRSQLGALLLAVAGAGLTIGPGSGGRPLGIALGFGAAIIYALYILAGSRLMRQVLAIPASTVIIAATAAVYTVLAALRGLHLPATPTGWAAVLAIALISTVVAIGTFLAGLERIGPADASTVATCEPAVTLALAAAVLGEAITPSRLAGGALILSAVVLLARQRPAEDELESRV
jgi:drug/metabolite transporter (DMT)-like permease